MSKFLLILDANHSRAKDFLRFTLLLKFVIDDQFNKAVYV